MPDVALKELLASIGHSAPPPGQVRFLGRDPVLSTRLRIGEAAAAALVGVGLLASELGVLRGLPEQRVGIDVRAAAVSLLSFLLLRGPGLGAFADARSRSTIALYRTRDGRWLHLHGGFPHLCDGLLALLRCDGDREAIARAVAERDALTLEEEIAERGLCGAVVRTNAEWMRHPQGAALAATPPVEIERIGDAPAEPLRAGGATLRPLSDVRVLDLTRVLAGPTCARTLAEHGAEVLRVDGPGLPHIPAFVLDTSHGKRRAHLDLGAPTDVETLRGLARGADVFSQSYRTGALARRGFGPHEVARLRPGIVYVSINCYGHAGPWQSRPGWEQLAQTVSGIAAEQGGPERPALLPAAACDYTTGYLGALGSLAALHRRAREGGSWHVRVSLCATAGWLLSLSRRDGEPRGLSLEELAALTTETRLPEGRLRHLGPVLELSDTRPCWSVPTGPPGTHAPRWSSAE